MIDIIFMGSSNEEVRILRGILVQSEGLVGGRLPLLPLFSI